MSARARIFAGVATLLAACSSEAAKPDPNAPPSTQAVAQSAATSSAAAAANTGSASASTPSANVTATTPQVSDAAVSQLLEGGAALSALPVRAVDSGKTFDPQLRNKLAPERPKHPSPL